jgi:hypothetical protein
MGHRELVIRRKKDLVYQFLELMIVEMLGSEWTTWVQILCANYFSLAFSLFPYT